MTRRLAAIFSPRLSSTRRRDRTQANGREILCQHTLVVLPSSGTRRSLDAGDPVDLLSVSAKAGS